MEHIEINQNSNVEIVNSNIISKLAEVTQDCDATSSLTGNLQTTNAYEDDVNFLTTKFPGLSINATQGLYLRIADPTVQNILATNFGDGTYITNTQAQSLQHFNSKFANNTNIETFNELSKFTNITEINYNNRFNSCTNLKSIDLSNITKISGGNSYERWNFELCSNLEDVGDTSNCTYFGCNAFTTCPKLAEVNLVNATYIGGYAFDGCVNLTNINCNLTKVETIGDNAFRQCSNISLLSTINLPNLNGSLYGSFRSCTQIQHITSLGSLSTMRGVYSNDGAFWGCTGLLDVILPETLTSIGLCVFGNCRNIRYIKILAVSVPTYQLTDAYGNTQTYGKSFGEQYRNNDATQEYLGYTYPIYVKDELLSQYKAADGWKYVGPNRLRPLSQFATDFPNG